MNLSRELLADFAPMAERAVSADAGTLLRLRAHGQTVSGFVRLPYEVLAGRTIMAASEPFDLTCSAADFLAWQGGTGPEPARQDVRWLTGLPPRAGWQRVEVVPDAAVREVVRSGAALAPSATTRAGQEALLDSIVLTARSDSRTVEVPLGPLSALVRMGFLPPDGQAAVDTAPGWIRVAAVYGSTYVSDGNPLGLLSL
ncbi:MAG TPA: hypothetical protein VMB79_11030 [Jatrophihabitans sp.]|nr:hypothetical protein [Jatrophihabitans sp.]